MENKAGSVAYLRKLDHQIQHQCQQGSLNLGLWSILRTGFGI